MGQVDGAGGTPGRPKDGGAIPVAAMVESIVGCKWSIRLRKMARFTDYDAFAWVHNKNWGGDSAQRFFPVLERLLLPLLPSRARVLDLCYGTGQLAHMLAQRAFPVTGIDGSQEMIRLARIDAPDVEFLVEDARPVHVPATYHAVVSTYDSLNHVTSSEDLSDVFRKCTCMSATRRLVSV